MGISDQHTGETIGMYFLYILIREYEKPRIISYSGRVDYPKRLKYSLMGDNIIKNFEFSLSASER